MPGERWTITRVAAVATLAVAMLFSNVLPALTGVLARNLGFSANVLGALGTASMTGSAIGSLSAVALSKRLSPRILVTCGLVTFMVANLTLCLFPAALPMILISAVAGLGSGLTTSACYYVFGLQEQEKNTAAGMLAQTALASVVITWIPITTRLYDWRAMYVCFAICALPCLALARHFPRSYLHALKKDTAPANEPRRHEYWGLLPVLFSVIAIVMVWTYLDRMGGQAGVPQSSINQALSLSTVLGFFSSALVIWGGRPITAPPILAVCVMINIAGTLATGSSASIVYITGVILFNLSLPIYLAGQFGITMRGARSQRFAVKYSLAMHAAALGPLLGGYIAQTRGFGVMRGVAISMMLVSCCILCLAAARNGLSPISPRGSVSTVS